MTKSQTTEARLHRIGVFSTLMLVCLLGWPATLQAQQWQTTGNDIHNTNSGNVGVGNNNPGYLLDLAKAGAVTSTSTYDQANPLITVRNTSATNNNYGGIGFANSASSGFLTSAIYGVNESHTTTPSGNLQFWVKSAGSFAEAMRIAANGNVGIGISPSTKLHVNGDVTVTGNIAAKYQDIAEWVESSQELLSGTVVVLDASGSNRVVASTRSYDTAVAGVISNQPGITLGEQSEHKVLVATTGRVKVRVSTKGGTIQIGDLLVTSDEPGLAMKSQAVDIGGIRLHRPGTLIGKALEPLATGKGEILVLLSLQ